MVFPAAALLALSGCAREGPPADAPLVQEERSSGLASVVHVADPGTGAQLLKGWHAVEQGSWRWTEKQFSVALRPPAPGRDAKLTFKFALPDTLIRRLGPVTLSASVDKTALPPQTFRSPGDQVYSQPVPSAALTGDIVRIDFTLDKALPPDDNDRRELGVVASSIALE